jgi:hypothetical protein
LQSEKKKRGETTGEKTKQNFPFKNQNKSPYREQKKKGQG